MKERNPLLGGISGHVVLLLLVLVLVLGACDETQDTGAADTGEEGAAAEEGEGEAPPPSDADLTTLVPGGEFWYGSTPDDPEANEDEQTQHQVYLPDFVIYTFEVTNLMYARCVEEGACTPPHEPEEGEPQYGNREFDLMPVVNVDWQQASDYCVWDEGRLPTEAEWEKAARGSEAFTYPWGEDEPNCELTNMQGCASELEEVSTHVSGQSPWGVFNMSGNAYEWVGDWYSPVSYAYSLASSPSGALFGDLKVVRGGSFEDGPLTHRSAFRFALDPDSFNSHTGFRCVLAGETEMAYAPFCANTYTPFCIPDACIPRIGRQLQLLRPNISVVAVGCPQGSRTAISVDTGLPSTQGLSMYVNGLPYNDCYEDPNYPGRMYCNGNSPPANFDVKVTICSDTCEDEPALLSVMQPLEVSDDTSNQGTPQENGLPQTQDGNGMDGNGMDGYCPEGYEFIDRQCQLIPTGDNCNPGWSYNPQTYQCEPDDQVDCPPGTNYTTALAGTPGCQPDDGQGCPEGYSYNRLTQTCDPPQNQDGFCLPGYYFNRDINCCLPLQRDNYGCEDGEYYQPDAVSNQTTLAALFPPGDGCQPVTWDGCAQGFHYDRQEGCVPDTPDEPPNDENTRGNCPEGTQVDDSGACVPVNGNDTPECDEGSTYNPDLKRCVQDGGDPGDCVPGYNLTAANTENCTPNDGPGSTCGYGYAYNPRLDCCVPDPGTPGSECPEDEQQGGTNMAYFSTAMTNFNYQAGFCTDGECPEGYYLDEQTNTCVPIQDGCPPGTQLRAFDQQCEPTTPGQCPEGTILSFANNACIPDTPNTPDCGEGMYFDPVVGYCMDTSTNGCAPGFIMNNFSQTCISESNTSSTSSEQQCPPGAHFDTQQRDCVPDGNGGRCWTVVISVPECEEPQNPGDLCPPGHPYIAQTGMCARDPVGCTGRKCP